jgi:hypothetical protein
MSTVTIKDIGIALLAGILNQTNNIAAVKMGMNASSASRKFDMSGSVYC